MIHSKQLKALKSETETEILFCCNCGIEIDSILDVPCWNEQGEVYCEKCY